MKRSRLSHNRQPAATPPQKVWPPKTIAFNGEVAAFADIAARKMFDGVRTIPFPSFEQAMNAVRDGQAGAALIPIENSLAGPVADTRMSIPRSGLQIVAEQFLPIELHVMGLKNAKLNKVKRVISHEHALLQAKSFIEQQGWAIEKCASTSTAAQMVKAKGDASTVAIASDLAASVHGLTILKTHVEGTKALKNPRDRDTGPDNYTRFVLMAPSSAKLWPDAAEPSITACMFRARHIPSSLYKCLGSFATRGVNMLKIESYIRPLTGNASFYIEVEGHPDQDAVRGAFEELSFFSDDITILGVFSPHPIRQQLQTANSVEPLRRMASKPRPTARRKAA